MSNLISPQQLCTLLNDLFSGFDDIMSFYHLEKIRTVGYVSLLLLSFKLLITPHPQGCLLVRGKHVSSDRQPRRSGSLRGSAHDQSSAQDARRPASACGDRLGSACCWSDWNHEMGTPFLPPYILAFFFIYFSFFLSFSSFVEL